MLGDTRNTNIARRAQLNDDYIKTSRNVTLQRVVDDLVKEKMNDSLVRTKRDSYTAKLVSLAMMGVTIQKDALHKQVLMQYKKSQI